jgi:hypothetical protein
MLTGQDTNYFGSTTINSGSELELSGAAILNSAVTINGSGKLIISGHNVYPNYDNLVPTILTADIKSLSGSGEVVINGDALKISAGDTLDPSGYTYSGIISGSGGLILRNVNQTLSGTNTYGHNLDGNISITAVSGGTLNISRIENLGDSTVLSLADGGSIHITDTIDMSSRYLNVRKVFTPTESGSIDIDSNKTLTIGFIAESSSAALTKKGAGTLVIKETNDTLGKSLATINIDAGSLIVGSSEGSSAAVRVNDALNVNSAGNLYGHGTIFGNVFNYGNVNPGGSIGTLTVVENYTQDASGMLSIEIGPELNNNSQIKINGLATLNGKLSINALSGNYTLGSHYKILDAQTLTGMFSQPIESSGKRLKYGLTYDAPNADVYLDILGLGGPSAADTQSSMRYQASQLRSAFNTQTVAANFALNYDCNIFDIKGMCISAGGRYTTIDNPGINNSAAVVTLGYKMNPNIRIGAYLDQNINISKPTGINISNNTPLMGLYALWNKEQSGLGYQVRLANTFQDKDVTATRVAYGDTGEAGSGKSSLKSQSYLAELSYAFQYQDKTLVRPYAGLRYTHLKQDGYTEETVAGSVDNPLIVASLKDKSATALLGVKINRNLTDKATLTAQLGLEQDLYHKTDNYSATNSDIGDLSLIAFNSNVKRTRPVASLGAFYDVTKTQRASATINYQQTPFQSTGSATANFNYMIGF